ncbi:hypothetical protein NH340_JMT04753 [Sarcoptes scabiei]|nr:hypothetical protein NH340_JMT04753 [Sarcoptes scabiei]
MSNRNILLQIILLIDSILSDRISHSAPVLNTTEIDFINKNPLNSRLIRLNSSSIYSFRIEPFKPNESFAIVGIHSAIHNVSLCHRTNSRSILLEAFDFGLAIQSEHSWPICLLNRHPRPINVLLIENRYNQNDPIPGGCNIEFPLEISPFIQIRPTEFLLVNYLLFQRAALGNQKNWKHKCDRYAGHQIEYRIHVYYENHRDFRSDRADDDDDDYEDYEIEHYHRIEQMSRSDWINHHSTMIAKIDYRSNLFRLYFVSNLNQKIYFTIIVSENSGTNTTESFSVYVPNAFTARLDRNIVFLTILALLALLSTIVSIIGHRYFILEIFYFTFIVILILSSSIITKIPSLLNVPFVWLYAILISMMIASVWMLFCRWTRNLRLALSLHSLMLSFWLVAFSFDLFMLTGLHWHPLNETYLNLAIGSAILVLHLLFLSFINLFWLSALSTSIITVYLQLLPFDCLNYFGNVSLFRIIFNLWLHNHQHSSMESTPIVNLIFLTKHDLLTFICFIFCVSISIAWQFWSKIGNLAYGFACIGVPTAIPPQTLTSSSSSSMKSSPSSTKSHQTNPRRSHRKPNHRSRTHSKSILNRKSRSPKILSNKTKDSRSFDRKNGSKKKLYRCKYCNKLSTSPCTNRKSTKTIIDTNRNGRTNNHSKNKYQIYP